MTGKRIVSYVLAIIMLVSTCAINVSAALGDTSSSEKSQAEAHQETWDTSGRSNKTTLFIGDSYFSQNFWPGFYEMYSGKDVLRAGIAGTTTHDWEYFLTNETFLVDTVPKNIVVHMGHNNIHYSYEDTNGNDVIGGDDAATAATNLQNLFTNIHAKDNLKNAKIYFFGITYKKSTMYDGSPYPESYKTTVDTVNASMKAWCAGQTWITYIEPVQTVEGYCDDWYVDNTHLTAENYQTMVDLLAATDIVIENAPENDGAGLYYAQADANAEEWNAYGNPGKTTLFIGDSFFSKKYWDGFYDTYDGRDVMLAGIAETSALDWQELLDRYLVNTKPKNLVIHLGTEDIHEDGCTGYQTSENLKKLFEDIHASENLADTHIYYFGVPKCKHADLSDAVDASNDAMKTWCADYDWLTYIEPLSIEQSQFLDEINLTADGYQLVVDKLADIVEIEPAVAVDFDKGNVTNSAANSSIAVGTYELSGSGTSSTFADYTGTVEYTNGRNGDAGCAIVTNHQNGPYAAIKNYAFGTNDFVISTWFNVEDAASLTDSSGSYLFGIAHPNETTGFSACIKKNDSGKYELRLRADETSKFVPIADYTDFEDNTWYNLTLCRDGASLKWYLNGTYLEDYVHSISESTDYKTTDLVFGAYKAFDGTYKDANVYFDDIKVYDSSLNDAEVAAICEDRNIEDARDVTCVVGDANYDDAFNTADLIRLQRYLVTTKVDECSLDGDLNVSGKANTPDIDRCMEMLIGDKALWVEASADESYKRLQSTENYYTYYELHKGMKAGQTITFDIIFGEGDYSAYAYYDGCGRWEPLEDTDASKANVQCKLVAAEDMKSLRIKVVNNKTNTVVSNYEVYDIKVEKTEKNANRVNLAMTYDQDVKAPILYGMSETLDMTKFAVKTSTSGLTYEWTLMKDGVEKSVDMTATAFTFDEPGTYLLTATETATGNGYRTSMNIYVFGPDVYANYNNGTVANSGLDSSATVGTYKQSQSGDVNGTFVDYTNTVNYTTGRSGDANGAIVTNHVNGPYTVVDNGGFGTDNFIVSTWFNVPSEMAMIKDYGYLFGTVDPDYGAPETDTSARTKEGFFAALQYYTPDNGTPYYRLRLEGYQKHSSEDSASRWYTLTDFECDKWYHLTLCRDDSTLYWYLNGTLIKQHTIPEDTDYGTSVLAIGGYAGWEYTYRNASMLFDDIEVYGSDLTAKQVRKICEDCNLDDPKVSINYAGGTVVNSETDSSVEVGTYNFTDSNPANAFTETSSVKYTTGVSGDARGAIATHHQSGAYTVVKGYAFGTNDFTVSTWINVPTDGISGAGNTYLFGTTEPTTGSDGFAISLRKTTDSTTSTEKYSVRVRLLGTNSDSNTQETAITTFTCDTWHNVIVKRSGTVFKVYFDGIVVGTYTLKETDDFGTKDLAFGAYTRTDNDTYYNNYMYYDEVEVYDAALTESQIQEICDRYDTEPDIFVNYASGTVTNKGIYRNILLGRYMFNNASKSDYFVPATNDKYVTGVGGDENGAISINHHDGAYTAAHDYRFGTDNFTVSTWFKIPSDSEGNVDMSVSGTYLMGSTDPDAIDGFSVTIKYDDYTHTGSSETIKAYYLRLRLLGSTHFYVFEEDEGHIAFNSNEWYHLTVCREGSSFKLYLDGELALEDTMAESIDLGIENINIGASAGWGSPYRDVNTYFDEVQVYQGAMTAGDAKVMTEKYKTSN